MPETNIYPVKTPKKLIEVALPLDAINEAASREKSIRHGHPSTLHLWWARRPLAAARAVIFAQMVNDPGWRFDMDGTKPTPQQKAAITRKREALFKIIENLVVWENTTDEAVLKSAREEIRKSWQETCELNKDHPQAAELFNPDKLPAFHDPFAGGGALPLEAQRLGLESYASDLNPVAVMINKAMIEIPPLFAGQKPVHPKDMNDIGSYGEKVYTGAQGLAEDVAYYGRWMRDEAEKKIGYLYPKVKVTQEMVSERSDLREYLGKELTVIAYIWARTVKSPNPAYSDVDVPLASTFVLSKRKGKEAWIEPMIDGSRYTFKVRVGNPPEEAENGTSTGKRQAFKCLLSNAVIDYDYLRKEGKKKQLGKILMAVVCEGNTERVYISPNSTDLSIITKSPINWKPSMLLPNNPRDFKTPNYGMTTYEDLFTNRQLIALNTFSDYISEIVNIIQKDAIISGMSNDTIGIEDNGIGATAYAQSVTVYLCFAFDKMIDLNNSLVRWENIAQCPRQLFGRQAIPMVWDFAEANMLSNSSGSWITFIDGITKSFEKCFSWETRENKGFVEQVDAQTQNISLNKVISTDPPYYDNIGYADLSDFFYVWMRHNLRNIYPSLFATMAVPKEEELVATPYRHGSKENAEQFFLTGMTQTMENLVDLAHSAYPVTIYYAFKQSETTETGATSSTGWETFLQAVLDAGFVITGTWPMKTENRSRMIGQGKNALASSIVLVCRRRPVSSPSIGRREFLHELRSVMTDALVEMTRGGENSPVAPVDLSQAIIGPGMAVFSKYTSVLEADGSAMPVRTALRLINSYMAQDDFDSATLFCMDWYRENGWNPGQFGSADVLARAKTTSVDLLTAEGVVRSGQGKVQLVPWNEYADTLAGIVQPRASVWFILHLCIAQLSVHGTEGAAKVYTQYPAQTAAVRQLAYRMYTLCERAGKAEDARVYNELIMSWEGIETAAPSVREETNPQQELFS